MANSMASVTFGYRERFILLLGSAVSLLIFFWAGKTFAVPFYAGQEGSLLQMPSSAAAFLVVAVVLTVCTLLGTLLAASVHPEAGFFLAVVGLSALSMRGGTMGTLLRSSATPQVFLVLAGELVLLYVMLGVIWCGLDQLRRHGRLPGMPSAGAPAPGHPWTSNLTVTVAHVVTTTLLMLLLARSEAKAQILVAVAVSSWAGSLAAYKFNPEASSVWYWTGPLLVGLVGYVAAYASPDGWMIGRPESMLGPLAWPLPLDYASFGTAGALFGQWMAGRWFDGESEAGTAAA